MRCKNIGALSVYSGRGTKLLQEYSVDPKKLLESLYIQSWNTPDRVSSTLLGHLIDGEFIEPTITLKIHKGLFESIQKHAGMTGLTPQEFLVDCAAFGIYELGILLDFIEVKERTDYEETRKAGQVREH